MKHRNLTWAAVTLTAVILALMAGWTLGTFHSRQLLRQTAPANQPAYSQPPESVPVTTEPAVEFPLNINTATAEQLIMLPGIGEVRAEAIVTWRERHGRFHTEAELLRVPGIGETTLEGLLDYITVGG